MFAFLLICREHKIGNLLIVPTCGNAEKEFEFTVVLHAAHGPNVSINLNGGLSKFCDGGDASLNKLFCVVEFDFFVNAPASVGRFISL